MHFNAVRLLLAVQQTPLHQLRHVSREAWLNLAICIIGIVVVVRLWRTLRSLNDYAPYLAACVFSCGVFCYWVYTRTEPAFLTPVVEKLTPFLPTQTKQQEYIDRARQSRES